MDQPNDTTVELLNAKQVATLLNISERTVYRLKKSGQLPSAVELGGSVRWGRKQLNQWIEAGCPHEKTSNYRSETKDNT